VLAGDQPQLLHRSLELLRILPRVAHADVEHDLHQPRHLVRVGQAEVLLDLGPHGLLVELLQPRRALGRLGGVVHGAGGGLVLLALAGRVLRGALLGRRLLRRLGLLGGLGHCYRFLGID
jgi:hypothetical protein